MKFLKTLHGKIELPAFFPDATSGAVRGVDSFDVAKTKTQGLVVNAYHLLASGLNKEIKKMGGIHKYMNWPGVLISDSGGFQAMSLVREHASWGKITSDGVLFFSPQLKKKIMLTPEKSIEVQMDLGADILMVLDDCTKPDESLSEQEKSVERTIKWAKRCKEEFIRQTKNKKNKPMLFAIIQGGDNKRLRKYCAEELVKIGFDGYSYGGWPIDKNRRLMKTILKFTADLMPDKFSKYAMGVGKPKDISVCVKMGYDLFDCVIPTREARHGRLYVLTKPLKKINFKNNNWYAHLFINKSIFINDIRPISNFCDCFACQNYSRAYLYNLLKIKDPLFIRLATIHNLRFYSQMMEKLLRKRSYIKKAGAH